MASGDDRRTERRLASASTVVVFFTLLAGMFEVDRLFPALSGLPDPYWLGIAVLVACLLGPLGAAARRTEPEPNVVATWVMWFSIFTFVLALSSLWSTATGDQWLQAARLVSLLVPLTALRWSIRVSSEATVSTFFGCCVVVGLMYAASGIASAGTTSRIAAFGGGPNVFARVTGLGVVGLCYFVMARRRSSGLLLLVVPLVAATVLSGSRGGMAGLLVAILLLVLGANLRSLRRVLVGAVLATPFVVVLYANYGSLVVAAIQQRVLKLTFQEGYLSGRGDLWAAALTMSEERPVWGHGLETFQSIYAFYPHNLFLDVSVSAGLLGLVPLVVVLALATRQAARRPFRQPARVALTAGAALILVSSMFSGGLYDARFLWVFLLMVVALPRNRALVGSREGSQLVSAGPGVGPVGAVVRPTASA